MRNRRSGRGCWWAARMNFLSGSACCWFQRRSSSWIILRFDGTKLEGEDQIALRVGVVGFEPNRLSKGGDGFVEPAHLFKGAAIVERFRGTGA